MITPTRRQILLSGAALATLALPAHAQGAVPLLQGNQPFYPDQLGLVGLHQIPAHRSPVFRVAAAGHADFAAVIHIG